MKVEDFVSYYNLMHVAEDFFFFTVVDFDGEKRLKFYSGEDENRITVSQLFNEYDYLEINDIFEQHFRSIDFYCLSKVLKDDYFTPTTLIPYLRELFDSYRQSFDDPFTWLFATLDYIVSNPDSFKAELRGPLEKNLTEWIEAYAIINKRIIYEVEQPQINLESIFKNEKDLTKLVTLLMQREFITMKDESLSWTGKTHDRANGKGLQLVALSEVCRPLYRPAHLVYNTKRNDYTAIELNAAWTKYFNYTMDPNRWQKKQIETHLTEDYYRLFNFVKGAFGFR